MISVKKLIYKIIDRIHYVPLYGSITGMIVNDKSVSGNGARSLSMGLTKSAAVEAETEPSKTETDKTETR